MSICSGLGVVASSVQAGDFSVYHIGNSLTGDLFSKFGSIAETYAKAQGQTSHWAAHYRGATSLTYMFQNPTGPRTSSLEKGSQWKNVDGKAAGFVPWSTALPGRHWDVVTLQPWNDGTKATLKGDTDAVNAIIATTRTRADNASTRFFIYAPWTGVKYDDFDSFTKSFLEETSDNPDQLMKATRDYFRHVTDSVRRTNPDVGMIPVGEVHLALDEKMRAGKFEHLTGVRDLHRDVIHANQIGAYVAAWTAYAVIFKKSPVGLPITINPGKDYPPFKEVRDVSPADLKLMQETVWEVVNSPELRGYTNMEK